ncbi:MAG TPA: molybdopterin-dependent oxidoreductase [Chitinophagaceae bacterium]|nr:molybdopterin-dependent oxidoreductase [Chitinophagaceae bacterium]
MKRTEPHLKESTISEKRLRSKTVLSFLVFVVLAVSVGLIFGWMRTQPKDAGAPKPLQAALNTNEAIFSALFDSSKLVKEYPVKEAVKDVRVNGMEGLRDVVDMSLWRLQVVRKRGDTLRLTLDDIKALPKRDIVFDFKCIEGWSQITHWAGVPLKTFMEHYGLQEEEKLQYVGLQTPDKKYYVGIDMPSALHTQTLLCYEMNGKPLPMNQGYPLRLIIPEKYGVKHLKRIGTMFFSDAKPADFWAERGYDYYAGH